MVMAIWVRLRPVGELVYLKLLLSLQYLLRAWAANAGVRTHFEISTASDLRKCSYGNDPGDRGMNCDKCWPDCNPLSGLSGEHRSPPVLATLTFGNLQMFLKSDWVFTR